MMEGKRNRFHIQGVFLSLLKLLLLFGVLASQKFDKLPVQCNGSVYLSLWNVDGLLHCSVKCASEIDCYAFTFQEDMMVCSLHSVHSPCCKGSTWQRAVSYQRKVSACQFEVRYGKSISLLSHCGPQFVKPLLLFRVIRGRKSLVKIMGMTYLEYKMRFFESYMKMLMVNNLQLVSKKYFREDYNPNIWSYYWVTIIWNGTTGIGLGMNGKPGCNSLGEVYDNYQRFRLSDVMLRVTSPGREATFTFYHYE